MSWWSELFGDTQSYPNDRDMIADQIKEYQKQTELAKQELEDARQQSATEKRRINEKQIRALRSRFRGQSSGMLGTGTPASSDMSSQLGG